MIEIKSKNKCCGCEACAQICPQKCIELNKDCEGFIYPKVDINHCINCNLCVKVCPELHPGKPVNLLKVYGAYSEDKCCVDRATSGGIFTLLADYVIRSNGIVFGATFDNQWNVCHMSEQGDAFRFAGSKYVASRIGNTYIDVREYLKQGKFVLFSGTSCEIRGLINFLGQDYENLLTVEVVCHGVPSPDVWAKYRDNWMYDPSFCVGDEQKARYQEHELYSIRNIKFRDKSLGWQNYSMCFSVQNSEDHRIVNFRSGKKSNLYLRAFINNVILRPCCYSCKFKQFNSGADLILGDFWGISKIKSNIDNEKGVSAVLVLTPKGLRYFTQLSVIREEFNLEDVTNQNPAICTPAKIPRNRSRFFAGFANGVDVIGLLDKYSKKPLPIRIRWKVIQIAQRLRILSILKSIKK